MQLKHVHISTQNNTCNTLLGIASKHCWVTLMLSIKQCQYLQTGLARKTREAAYLHLMWISSNFLASSIKMPYLMSLVDMTYSSRSPLSPVTSLIHLAWDWGPKLRCLSQNGLEIYLRSYLRKIINNLASQLKASGLILGHLGVEPKIYFRIFCSKMKTETSIQLQLVN